MSQYFHGAAGYVRRTHPPAIAALSQTPHMIGNKQNFFFKRIGILMERSRKAQD